MNLPHVKQPLGSKSLRALSNPLVVRGGGRQTLDNNAFGNDWEYSRFEPSAAWRTLDTQRKGLFDIPFTRLLRYGIEISPELGKALHDFQRFCNPGRRTDNDSGDRAKNATIAFQKDISRFYSSFSSHMDTIFSSIFTTGAVFPELVLTPDSRMPVDIVLNDPLSAIFIQKHHPVRGQYPALHQRQGYGQLVDLSENPLIKYIPFDNLIGDPYGRPLIGGGVYSALILLGLIRDTQRAIANAGLSRIDYELDTEEMLRLIDRNPDIAGDDEATAQFIGEHTEVIKQTLRSLEVDDNYVHLSTIKVNYATNPMTSNYSGITQAIDTLRTSIATGAKTYSVLMNINDSSTDARSIRQLEAFIAAIMSVQEEVSGTMNEYFDVGNNVQGIRSKSRFIFLKQRVRDKKDIAETEKIELDNINVAKEQGYISQEDATQRYLDLRDPLVV